jgi:hypothetical protein
MGMRWLAAYLIAVGLIGCASTASPTPIDPQAVYARLEKTTSLDAAAQQMAAALGASVDAIRVQLTTGACVSCSGVVEPTQRIGPEGVPVAEVPRPLPKGSSLWLRIGDVVCFYYYDGAALSPEACQIIPVSTNRPTNR